MKKSIAATLAILLTLALFSGCSGKKESSSSEDIGSGESSFVSSSQEEKKSYDIEEAFHAVQEAYGEDFLPSLDFEDQQITAMGVNLDDVEAYRAMGPAMSAHVDTLAAFQAKEGRGSEVQTQLEKYRQKLLDDAVSYPMNLPKIEASKVVSYGDYVFFLMLGKYTDDDLKEEELLNYYEAQTKIGTDALKKFFEE